MPTIEELKTRLNYYVDDDVDAETAISMFNEALEDLSDVAGYEKEETFTLQANETNITLPDDLIKVYMVTITVGNVTTNIRKESNKRNISHYDDMSYRIHGDTLTMINPPKQDYSLLLTYNADLPSVPTLEQDSSLQYVPKLQKRFHKALPLYAAFKYFQNWEDNAGLRGEFITQYQDAKMSVDAEGRNIKKRYRSNKVHVDRGWW